MLFVVVFYSDIGYLLTAGCAGLARIEYCKCANLTSALLDEKSVPELKQIAANLSVEVESTASADTVSLRDRLKMFILYG